MAWFIGLAYHLFRDLGLQAAICDIVSLMDF